MLREMMKSKIHRATVTDAHLDYVGSLTVDADLMRAADLPLACFLAAAAQAGPQPGWKWTVIGAVGEEGDSRGARKALERALQIEPGLETARAQLKKLRWSFLG